MFGSSNFNVVKDGICVVVGVIGSAIATAFGGWSSSMTTLLIFMGIDYIMGMVVAGVFHKSKKSADGRLESRAGWKGLCRKGFTLVIVLIACRLDILLNSTFIRDACVIGFIANETISIVENAGLMGIPIPNVIKQAITVLKGKADENEYKVKEMAKQAKKDMKARRDKDKAEKEAEKTTIKTYPNDGSTMTIQANNNKDDTWHINEAEKTENKDV